MVEKFVPETSLELTQCIMSYGTEFERDFYANNAGTRDFQAMVDAQIYNTQLSYKYVPWLECMDKLFLPLVAMKKNLMTVEDSVSWILRIFEHNGINPTDFMTNLLDIMDRKKSKKNALWLYGPPSCGKSLLVNSIGDSALVAYRCDQPDPREARFVYAGLACARVGIFNEFRMYSNVADKCLLLLEGANVANDVKNKTAVNIQRTPMLMTTNGLLWDCLPSREQQMKIPAINARVTRYNMSYMEDLKDCPGEIHPLAWRFMINNYALVEVDTNTDFINIFDLLNE